MYIKVLPLNKNKNVYKIKLASSPTSVYLILFNPKSMHCKIKHLFSNFLLADIPKLL